MNCPECGMSVEVVGETTQHYVLVDKRLEADTYKVPFYCPICGAIKFSHRAIRGVVFIWPLYKLDKRFENKNSKIIIPESIRRSELSDMGVVLSAGPGFYDRRQKNKWRNVAGLSVGMKVIYDKTTPWGIDVKGNDGRLHYVKICDVTDVLVEIDEEYDR